MKRFLKCIFNLLYHLMPFFFLISYSQETHQLSGKTQDSLQNPIPNTNIIATPLTQEEANITFAISSLEGEYKLRLQNNISYQIIIPLQNWTII